MKILILNWRDIKNPSGGGAEILTHEIAKRWVQNGHTVIQLSSVFPSASLEEKIDGVRIIRRGQPDARYMFNSVHFQAFLYYLRVFRGNVDVVIDEIHGLPFFTPLYVKEKKVALICEVADELWQKYYGSFFGTIGRLIEQFYLHVMYKNINYLTISESTKRDLLMHSVEKNRITVLPMGITTPRKTQTYSKEKHDTLIYVGRLSKSKGIEDLLRAFKDIISTNGDSKLWIVGRGEKEYDKFLRSMVIEMELKKCVTLFGYVDEEKKFDLIARSHVLVSPSSKEGFGLSIVEAGFMGTPSVVYNSPGLSEIVVDGETGIVCKENTPKALALEIQRLLKDKKLYKKLSEKVATKSKEYNWDRTAKVAVDVLENS